MLLWCTFAFKNNEHFKFCKVNFIEFLNGDMSKHKLKESRKSSEFCEGTFLFYRPWNQWPNLLLVLYEKMNVINMRKWKYGILLLHKSFSKGIKYVFFSPLAPFHFDSPITVNISHSIYYQKEQHFGFGWCQWIILWHFPYLHACKYLFAMVS